MVPILMLDEKTVGNPKPKGAHSTHAKYEIDQSIHIFSYLAVLCSGIPITTHSLCVILLALSK